MADRKKALSNVFLLLCAGVLIHTLVHLQRTRKLSGKNDLESKGFVDKASINEKTKTFELDFLAQVEKKLEIPKREEKFNIGEQRSKPQWQKPVHNEKLELKNRKLFYTMKKGKLRKPRAEPEVPPSSEPEVPPGSEPEVPSSSEPEVPPSSEPEVSPSSEPEVNPESEGEPERNSNASSEPESMLWAEPEPEWDTALKKWKVAWPLHVYGIASIFVFLGLVSLLELVRIHAKSRRKTALKVSLLIIIVIFTTTRAVTLFADPYGSKASLDPIVSRLLFAIGHPCITSAMSLLLLVLIDTTKMSVAPPTFQRVQFIIAVVSFHVVLLLVTEVVVTYYFQTKFLILICQIYYIIIGFILAIGYAKVGFKIALNSSASVTRDEKMEKLKILIGLASVTGIVMVGVAIYGAAGVFGVYSGVVIADAWPWWFFQTSTRLIEIVMVIILLVMNVNVSGSGLSIRALFRKCRRKMFSNQVDVTNSSIIQVKNSNSWVTRSVIN